ncbi:MAG: C39 family peptidase [Parcubacteria group bacterium]|nr:C39 family peptidase [Parcubacteria group bacterium]MCR4343063.1 C39 family peptidase [Patescibacteria group bacterium]
MKTNLITNLAVSIIFLTAFFVVPISVNAQILESLLEPIMPGMTSGEGIYFEITDSEYLNVSLGSSKDIKIIMESMPEMITLVIEPVLSSTSTQLIFFGLEPMTTYYKYQDDYHNLTEFKTNEDGIYTYTQDLSNPHLIFIQPRKSTKFIKDNATGGDCTSVGIWDSATKTCTLIADVNETIQIDDAKITLDGDGYAVIGSGTGFGVYLPIITGVTVKNLNISNFFIGVFVYISRNYYNNDQNIIVENTISDNYEGIDLRFSSNSIVSKNIISNNNKGISFGFYAENNIAMDNTFLNSDFLFSYSPNNKIYHNNFLNSSVIIYGESNNLFDNELPGGGNYWGSFDEPAEGCHDSNFDKFCDTPYIFSGGQDNYPWVKQDGWESPPILDVPKYYQNTTNTPQDPDWPNETYDLTSNTIYQKGCALASVTMLLNYYGANTTPDTLEPTNPHSLNRWLNRTDGYVTSTEQLGNIIWGAMDNFSDKESFVKDWETFDCTIGNLEECKNILNYDLDNERPVIIYTFNIDANINHFVVATGKADDSWYINDPFWLNENTPTRLSDNVYRDKILGLRRYKPEPATDLSFLNITLASPAELLIIDSQGRKTGFDPITQITYNDIPNTIYYHERLDNDETGQIGVEIKNLYISMPENAIYNLQVVGTATGPYGLSFNSRDIDGDSSVSVESGLTQEHFISEYLINYNSQPDSPVKIERTVTIQDIIVKVEIAGKLNLIDNDGIEDSLIQSLNQAEKKLSQGKTETTTNILQSVINELNAQSGKHIDSGTANILIEDIQFIISQNNLNSQSVRLSFMLADLHEALSSF